MTIDQAKPHEFQEMAGYAYCGLCGNYAGDRLHKMPSSKSHDAPCGGFCVRLGGARVLSDPRANPDKMPCDRCNFTALDHKSPPVAKSYAAPHKYVHDGVNRDMLNRCVCTRVEFDAHHTDRAVLGGLAKSYAEPCDKFAFPVAEFAGPDTLCGECGYDFKSHSENAINASGPLPKPLETPGRTAPQVGIVEFVEALLDTEIGDWQRWALEAFYGIGR